MSNEYEPDDAHDEYCCCDECCEAEEEWEDEPEEEEEDELQKNPPELKDLNARFVPVSERIARRLMIELLDSQEKSDDKEFRKNSPVMTIKKPDTNELTLVKALYRQHPQVVLDQQFRTLRSVKMLIEELGTPEKTDTGDGRRSLNHELSELAFVNMMNDHEIFLKIKHVLPLALQALQDVVMECKTGTSEEAKIIWDIIEKYFDTESGHVWTVREATPKPPKRITRIQKAVMVEVQPNPPEPLIDGTDCFC